MGSALLVRLVGEARATGSPSVHADVRTEDGFVLRALRRIGAVRVRCEGGSYAVDVALGGIEDRADR